MAVRAAPSYGAAAVAGVHARAVGRLGPSLSGAVAVLLLASCGVRRASPRSLSFVIAADGRQQAAFTLLAAVFHVSSSHEHLSATELVLPDSLALALWCGVLGQAALARRAQWGSLVVQTTLWCVFWSPVLGGAYADEG